MYGRSEDWAHDYELAEEVELENSQLQAAHFGDLEPLVDIGTRPDGSFYHGGVNRGEGLGEYAQRYLRRR